MKYINIILIFLFISFPVQSDQFDLRLTSLFEKLYFSDSDKEINNITNEIWDIWHETNDKKIEADFYKGIECMNDSDLLMAIVYFTKVIQMKPNFGPYLPNPIRTSKDVKNVIIPDVNNKLDYVYDAIKATKELLNDEVPLIGFAGSPWTILCYCVQGQGSKNFDKAKAFCFSNPTAAHELLQKITDTTISYLIEKVNSGVDAIQIFDSWGGMLSPNDYQEFSWQYIDQIIEALKEKAPVIAFGKGCWFALNEMAKSNAAGIGIDWTCSARNARYLTGGNKTLQGNFDPSRLLSPPKVIKKMVHEMIDSFGKDRYIVNLGHGILPNIPVNHAKAFIDAVKSYSSLT